MARRLGPRLKLSRRYGTPLFGTAKEAKILQRRNYPPGQHGPSASGRISEYGTQLREKQKAKIIYGLLERQFRKYFQEALGRTGDTGLLLLQYLERRLDNVVFRLGWATTRAQARQLVSHGHILVNDRRVDIPSFRVKAGDRIQVRPQSRPAGYFATVQKTLENYQAPAWLEVQAADLAGRVLELPSDDQLDRTIQPKLIVEFYSR
jgi:small subunit ribosomal protein S4